MKTSLARLVAGPVAAAGVIGAAMGLAAIANANPGPELSPHTPAVVKPHQESTLSEQLQQQMQQAAEGQYTNQLSDLQAQLQSVQQVASRLQQLQAFRNQYTQAPKTPEWSVQNRVPMAAAPR